MNDTPDRVEYDTREYYRTLEEETEEERLTRESLDNISDICAEISTLIDHNDFELYLDEVERVERKMHLLLEAFQSTKS
jgi:hypothetical protein